MDYLGTVVLSGAHGTGKSTVGSLVADRAAHLATTVVPLGVGAALIEVDTTEAIDRRRLLSEVRAALKPV